MDPRFVSQALGAFLLAFLWSGVGMPAAVKIGRKRGLVVRPRLFGSRRRRSVSILGGVAVAGAALIGSVLSSGVSARLVGMISGGLLLLLLGYADDRSPAGGLTVWTRILVEAAIAFAAWLFGVQVEVVGIAWVDAIATVLVILAVVNSFNLLDNMDGVSGSTGAGVALSILAISAVTGQVVISTLSAALCGACLGFLRLNLVKAKIFLGNGGALFLGFLLVTSAMTLDLPFPAPWGLLALLLIFVVPAMDTSLAVMSRLLFGRRLTQGGVDHLSHRLVQLKIGQKATALAHAVVSILAGGALLAAIIFDARLILPIAIGIGVLLGSVLLLVRPYERVPLSRTRKLALGSIAFLLAGLVLTVWSSLGARDDLVRAREQLLDARVSLVGLDVEAAQEQLGSAEVAFVEAERKLSSWRTWVGWAVPGVHGNLKVAKALATSGSLVVEAGREGAKVLALLPSSDGKVTVPFSDGRLDIALLDRAAGPALRVKTLIREAQTLVDDTQAVVLVPGVKFARQEALAALAKAREQSDSAYAMTTLLPDLFGSDGKRTWVLAAENLAELRGRGGFIGELGELTADKGVLELGEFVPTSSLPQLDFTRSPSYAPEYEAHYERIGALHSWANLGMSPNFSSGAGVLLDKLRRAGVMQAEGVISMDPVALSYLLEAVGPLDLEGVPEPVTASNVVEWSLNKQYFQFAASAEDRKKTLGVVAEKVWSAVVDGGIDPRSLADVLSKSIRERHLTIYSADRQEQDLLGRLGLTRDVDKGGGDYFMVVSHNLGENKMDYYMRRSIRYRAKIEHDGSTASELQIDIKNSAPSTPLPDEVGGERPRLHLAAGESRSYLTAFVPQEAILDRVTVDGEVTDNFDNRAELTKRVLALYVELPPGTSKTVTFRYTIPGALYGDRYRLLAQRQATVEPDQVSISVDFPPEATLTYRSKALSAQRLRWSGPMQSDRSFILHAEVPPRVRLRDQLVDWLRTPVFELGD